MCERLRVSECAELIVRSGTAASESSLGSNCTNLYCDFLLFVLYRSILPRDAVLLYGAFDCVTTTERNYCPGHDGQFYDRDYTHAHPQTQLTAEIGEEIRPLNDETL